MEYNPEDIAKDLFEIASEQRLGILFRLGEKKSTVSTIARELDATVPEVFRNFERLTKAGLIAKDPDGKYHLTLYGKTFCAQIPSLVFLSQNKKYFENHDFGNIPKKFIQRIGSLGAAQHIKGVVMVLEKWKEIYKNADDYINNILTEVPYTGELIDEIVKKLGKEIKVSSIFSESAIIPKDRKNVLDKIDFKKYIQKEILQRRMLKEVNVAVLLNEKEACIMFPNVGSGVDMSEMLYSPEPEFHEWCLDYFDYCWKNSKVFQERKLSQ